MKVVLAVVIVTLSAGLGALAHEKKATTTTLEVFDWVVEVNKTSYAEQFELKEGARLTHVIEQFQGTKSMRVIVTPKDPKKVSHELDAITFSPLYLSRQLAVDCGDSAFNDTALVQRITDDLVPATSHTQDHVVYLGVGQLSHAKSNVPAHTHLILTFPLLCTDTNAERMAMIILEPKGFIGGGVAEPLGPHLLTTHNGLIHGPRG